MPLPASVSTGTVTGTFLNPNGTPAAGLVIFTPQVEYLLDATDNAIILPGRTVVELNAAGSFSVVLPATNDVDLNPTGWTYLVEVKTGGSDDFSFSMAVTAGSTIDVADVAPVAPSAGSEVGGGDGFGASPPQSWSDVGAARSNVFTFTRQPAPILTTTDSGLTTISWPTVINVTGLIDGAPAPYYLLYSTDHDPGDGGIGLAYADSPLGPFTADPGNPIFVDTDDIGDGVAEQCETPSVIWNPDTELFHMYYQIAHAPSGTQQRTRVVTTADFVTFSTPVYALEAGATPVGYPGGAIHTGYLRPYLMGNNWFGYSLLTAGDYSSTAMWYSRDGLEAWTLDPRPMGWASDLGDDVDDKITFNGFRLIQINGRMWVLTATATFDSGLVDFNAEWLMAQLSDDGRRLIGQPVYVTPPDAWEDGNRQGPGGVLLENGVLYVYYRADAVSTEECFGVAVGVLS